MATPSNQRMSEAYGCAQYRRHGSPGTIIRKFVDSMMLLDAVVRGCFVLRELHDGTRGCTRGRHNNTPEQTSLLEYSRMSSGSDRNPLATHAQIYASSLAGNNVSQVDSSLEPCVHGYLCD
jgi:hypothetical protein